MSKIKVRCNYCGKEIERYPSQVLSSVYCSRKCLSDYKREHHNITFNCEQCHKSVTVKKGNYVGRKNHFCSQECKNKWQIENLKREGLPASEYGGPGTRHSFAVEGSAAQRTLESAVVDDSQR